MERMLSIWKNSYSFKRWVLVFFVVIVTVLAVTDWKPFTLSTRPAKIEQSIVVSTACPTNESAVMTTFLNSRPICVHLASNDFVSRKIRLHGNWAAQQTKLIALLLENSSVKPAVFLDIGANIGWFTLVMAALGNKVIAIEPMHSNVRLLKMSVQASRLSENVTVYPHALGTSSEDCILISSKSNSGDGIMRCGISGQESINQIIGNKYAFRQYISVTRLDTLVRENIDVLKIDVEGSELLAVRSGEVLFDKYHVGHVISEYSTKFLREHGSDPYDYLNFFISRGYEVRIIDGNIADLYEQGAWKELPVYNLESDLRTLASERKVLDLWFSKKQAETKPEY